MKSTPIAEMEMTTSVQPLETRRQEKLLIQGEKMKRLKSHPLHGKLQALTKNRLKRQSMNHQPASGPMPTPMALLKVPPETAEAELTFCSQGSPQSASQLPAALSAPTTELK